MTGSIVPGRDIDEPRYAVLRYARHYIRQGWKIFMLGRDKTPLGNCTQCRDVDWTHDREACPCLSCHGFYAATDDITRVAMMIVNNPGGLLAMRTGLASGVMVLDFEAEGDVDRQTGETLPSGLDVLDSWESWTEGRSLTPTLRARSGSGGLHLLYRVAQPVKSGNRILPGVDLKAEGGYVALPTPGHSREWLVRTDLEPGGDRGPAEAPSSLVDWLGQRSKGAWGGTGRRDFGSGRPSGYDFHWCFENGAPGGMRDEFFNDLIFRWRKEGYDRGVVTAKVRAHWARCQQPPETHWFMPWEHVAYKIDRIFATVAPDESLTAAQLRWLGSVEQGVSNMGVIVERDEEAGTETVAVGKRMIVRRTR